MKTYGYGIKINPRTQELRDFCNFLQDLFKAGNTESPISDFSDGNFFLTYMPGDGIEESAWMDIVNKYSELSLKKY